MFAIKGESLEDYWDYTAKMFDWHGAKPGENLFPNMILDDGGDATMYVHLGLRAENAIRRRTTLRLRSRRPAFRLSLIHT